MKKLISFVVVFVIGGMTAGCGFVKDDPVALLNKDVKERAARFNSSNRLEVWHRESYQGSSEGWMSAQYEPLKNYSFDVQKTNSLVSPYTGVVTFTLWRYDTVDRTVFSTKTNALNPLQFTRFSEAGRTPIEFKVLYAFQDGKWVVKSQSMFKRDEWVECNLRSPPLGADDPDAFVSACLAACG